MRELLIPVAFDKNSEPEPLTISRFEELFDITYLHRLTFADWKTEARLRKKCARAKKREKVDPFATWLGTYHSMHIEAQKMPPIAIKWMHAKIGYGLFSTAPLKKWQFLGEYTGILRQRSRINPDINDYCFMYPWAWLPIKAYTIDSEKQGNYTRFINHSDVPNCESISVFHDGVYHIIFRAIRDIEPGEELTYDYGGIYWQRRKKLHEHER